MIRNLRLKFIGLCMGLLFLLLAVILVTANLMNYRSIVSYADTLIDILAENRGDFPEDMKLDMPRRDLPLHREQPTDTRYFTVQLDEEGNVLAADTGKISTVNDTEAAAYAQRALDTQKAAGFLEGFRYGIRENQSGALLLFVDCERRLHDFYLFLETNLWITLIGYGIVFLLITILSKRILKPFVDNYEKQKLFITDAGHELKTPLTIIDADVDVLGMEIGEDNEWLQDIQKQTRRLTAMTQALVELSRMEEAGEGLPKIDFPLSDVVAETAQSFQALALSQGKAFEMEIQPLLTLRGDDKALRQLTSILLDNAVKYSGPQGSIRLSLAKNGNSIQLAVENTSQPLSAEERKHLFDRFYRTDKSRSSETGGFGIGLSIARAIVAAHRGTIKATSPTEYSLRITASFPG